MLDALQSFIAGVGQTGQAMPLLVCAAVLAFTFLCIKYRTRAIGSTPLPYGPKCYQVPGAVPILGNMLFGMRHLSRLNELTVEMALEDIKKVGREAAAREGTACLSVPFMPAFLFLHVPEHIQYMMHKRFARYVKGDQWRSLAYPVFLRGWLVTDDADWSMARKIITTIFKSTGFRQQVAKTSRNNVQRLMLDELQAASEARPGSPGAVLDLQDLLHNLTMTTFLQVAVCPDLQGIDVPKFAKAFDEANHVIDQKFLLQPIYPLIELFTFKLGRFRRLGKYMRGTIKQIMVREQQALELEQQQKEKLGPAASDISMKPQPFNFVRQLLLASYPDGSPLTEADVIDNVLQTILAAKDTTAIAVSWGLYEMMMHPEIEYKLLAEARQLLLDSSDGPFEAVKGAKLTGDDTAVRDQDKAAAAAGGGLSSTQAVFTRLWEDIPKLKYLKAVFMETLRLHPPIPLEAKFAREDDVMPDGTFVPKGTAVMFCTYALNRLLPIWGEDNFTYRPERWLEMVSEPTMYEFPVFNAGPRLCAGKDIAEVQGPFLLLEILRRYKLHLVPGQTIVPLQSLVLPMKNGLKVTVTRRTEAEGAF